jgi:hypothetical protein
MSLMRYAGYVGVYWTKNTSGDGQGDYVSSVAGKRIGRGLESITTRRRLTITVSNLIR